MIATIIILILLVFNLGYAIAKHGEPRENWNGWVYFIFTIISLILYYYAGLFDKFGL